MKVNYNNVLIIVLLSPHAKQVTIAIVWTEWSSHIIIVCTNQHISILITNKITTYMKDEIEIRPC